jgi:hypothetical protein
MLNLSTDCDYELLASRWLANKHHAVNNIICAAVMRCLWKLRNDICFHGEMDKREASAGMDSEDAAMLAAHHYPSHFFSDGQNHQGKQ